MALGTGRGGGNKRSDPLYIIPMAMALALAAFAGAAMGLIWDSAGFGGTAPTAAQNGTAQD